MFALRYFANRFFPGRFFPKVGAVSVYVPAPGEALLTYGFENRTLYSRLEVRALPVPNEKRTLRMARNV